MIDSNIIELTAGIVSAHVSNNTTAAADVPNLITSVFNALSGVQSPVPAAPVRTQPAVSVRSSVKHDYIICLEDGAKLKMLKRYLRTNFNMTPEDYRAKWNLPRDYPMVAPAYAEKRRTLAKAIGLGRKKVAAVVDDVATAPAVKRAAKRIKKSIAAVLPVETTHAPTSPRKRVSKKAPSTGQAS